jgi:hypothetical protein
MVRPLTSDAEFIELWEKYQSPVKMSKILGISERNIMARRRTLEAKTGKQLDTKSAKFQRKLSHISSTHQSAARHHLGIENGVVLVFSDAHFWPSIRTTAFKGLMWAIKALKPKAIINNGDAFDGAAISRHPRIGWDSKPSVIEELKACEMALGEIEDSVAKGTKLVWALGNHDARFENRLANTVPEFMHVGGFKLSDHFPAWIPCWSCWPTEEVVIKHRMKGGVHATHNNAVTSGKSIVTGHLHSLKVTPFSDYNGERFGVDTGTLADVGGPQFVDYLEDNPVSWRSGFAVLTFYKGRLLWPELVHAMAPGLIQFRGQVIDVGSL